MVQWIFNAFDFEYFLKVMPVELVVTHGSSHTVTVTDGMTGKLIEGAVIDGVTTNAEGLATLTFPKAGMLEYKATLLGSARSDALYVAVA